MHDSGLLLPWKQLPTEAACSERLTEMTSPGEKSQPKAPPGQKGFNHLSNPRGNMMQRPKSPGNLADWEDSSIEMPVAKG